MASCKKIGIKIVRNLPPKYLMKISNTKFSKRRYVDTNTGKVEEFPRRGAFEINFLNVLIFSKFNLGAFPSMAYLACLIMQVQSRA